LTFVPLMRVTYGSRTPPASGGCRQEVLHRLEVALLEHARLLGRRVGVVGDRVPRAEDEVVSSASGTKSLMSGERLSVRLPRRIVAIWVSEPIGCDSPRRTLSTPAMNVVATAPRPGVRIPELAGGAGAGSGAGARAILRGRGTRHEGKSPERGECPSGRQDGGRGRAARRRARAHGGATARARVIDRQRHAVHVDDALHRGEPGGDA
jgi:hypothetical protein